MKGRARFLALSILMIGWSVLVAGTGMAAQDGGYDLTAELSPSSSTGFRKSGNPGMERGRLGFDTQWRESDERLFYADPSFCLRQPVNPELFVKIYIDPSGWCVLAFDHVTVASGGLLGPSLQWNGRSRPGRRCFALRLVSVPTPGSEPGPQNPAYDASGIWPIRLLPCPAPSIKYPM